MPASPPTEIPTDVDIRNAAWNAIGVPYTPTYAFPLYARQHHLGAPLSREVELGDRTLQAFTGGIVVCPTDQWNLVTHITY